MVCVVFVSGWVLKHDRYINFNNHYLVYVSAFTAEDVGLIMALTDVWYQSEARQMASGQWTHLGCKALFGHSTCLEGARR